MAKYFIIIYKEFNGNYWNNITNLCTHEINNDKYSDLIIINNDFKLCFYQTNGNVTECVFKTFFQRNKINNGDEIIIFGHEYAKGHPGISASVLDSIKKNYANLEYRLFSTSAPNSYPCKLLYSLNESIKQKKINIKNLKEQLSKQKIKFDWKTLQEEVKKKIEVNILSFFKHRIVNLLEPLRIDVQGLTEKNFDENYWKQVVKAHKNLSEEFQSAKNLIYGTSTSGASEPKSIKAIISNITDDEIKNYLNALLKKIEELFPEDRKKLTGDNTVNSLLDAIKSNNKKEFKRITTLYGNVYKKWMDELIDCIDQLMLEIQDNK